MDTMTPQLWELLEKVAAEHTSFDLRYDAPTENLGQLDSLVERGFASYHEDTQHGYHIWYAITPLGDAALTAHRNEED